MKKVKICCAVSLILSALLLAGLFACMMKIGDLTGSTNDVGQGIATFFAILFTAIPLFLSLPVALALIVFGILLFVLKEGRKVAKASLIILSIFLPFLLFIVFINGITLAGQSTLFAAVLFSSLAVYCLAFGLSIAYLCLLRKQRKGEQA